VVCRQLAEEVNARRISLDFLSVAVTGSFFTKITSTLPVFIIQLLTFQNLQAYLFLSIGLAVLVGIMLVTNRQ